MVHACLDSRQLYLQHWCNSVVVARGTHAGAPKTIAQLAAAPLASPWTRSCMLLRGRCLQCSCSSFKLALHCLFSSALQNPQPRIDIYACCC
jgi:hypothetical protein